MIDIEIIFLFIDYYNRLTQYPVFYEVTVIFNLVIHLNRNLISICILYSCYCQIPVVRRSSSFLYYTQPETCCFYGKYLRTKLFQMKHPLVFILDERTSEAENK
jgi:hypothetical protein